MLTESEKKRLEELEGGLKLKEKLFASEYAKNGANAKAAALSAGYTEQTSRNAYKWLKEPRSNSDDESDYKPDLAEYKDLLLKSLQKDSIASAEEIMQYLTSVVRGEAQEDTVVMKGTGVGMTEAEHIKKTPSIKDQLRAAEILAKIMGIQKTNVNVTGITPIIIGGEDQLEE